MQPDAYEQLVEDARKGVVLVGVDRQAARQLFTDLPLEAIQEISGESPRLTRSVALVCFFGAPILVLLGGALSFLSVGWWAILVTPAVFATWVFYKSMSVRGDAGLVLISIAAAAVIWAALASGNPSEGLYPAALLVVAGLWMERFLYWFTTRQTRALVLRSRQAFEELRSALVIRRS